MNGDLAEGVVPDLLREIYVGRRNGTLTLERGEERHRLRFRRGHIVNAYTNGLEDAVALHVHEMLAKVFLWHEGSYAFEEAPGAEAGQELTLKLSTGELILEAVQAVRDPAVVRVALGDMDRVLALSNDPLLRFQKLTLSPEDAFVLSRVDGVTSAHEIVQMIPLPPERTQKSLLGLLSTGVVEFVGVRPSRKTAPAAGGERPHVAAVPAHPAPEPPPAAPAAAPRPEPADGKAAERRDILEAWEGLKTNTLFEVLGLSRSVGEAEVNVLPPREALSPGRAPRRLARGPARRARGGVHPPGRGARRAA